MTDEWRRRITYVSQNLQFGSTEGAAVLLEKVMWNFEWSAEQMNAFEQPLWGKIAVPAVDGLMFYVT